MSRLCVPTVLCLLLTLRTFAQTQPAHEPPIPPTFLRGDIFTALARGGGVYRVTAIQKQNVLRQSGMEYGTVDLHVDQTLAGPKRDALTLRYSFEFAFNKNGWEALWPEFTTDAPTQFIVVTSPFNPLEQKPADPRVAEFKAIEVHRLDPTHTDDLLKQMAEIAQLEKDRDAPDRAAALARAITSVNPAARRYAREAILAQIYPTRPGRAIAILESGWSDVPADVQADHGTVCIERVSEIAERATLQPTKAAAIQALFHAIENKNPAIQHAATMHLGATIQNLHINAAEVADPEQLGRTTAILAALPPDRTDAQRILRWLSGLPVPE